MATTPKKLYANKPGTTSATLYTVPTSTTTIVKNIVLCNTTGTAANVTLTVGGQTIINAYPVNANDTVTMDLSLVMSSADTITGLQATASAISVYISGVEVA
jgi:hypothetical protein